MSPFVLVLIFVASCAEWEVPVYGAVTYPSWAHNIGWVLAFLSIFQIPLWAIIMATVSLGDLGLMVTPTQAWVERRADDTNSTFIYKPDQSTSIVNESFITKMTEDGDRDLIFVSDRMNLDT